MPSDSRPGEDERGQPLSFSEQDGATSNVGYDEGTPSEHDGRARTATTFNPQEAPANRRERFRRLRRLQSEQRAEEAQKRRAEYRRDAALVCDRLQLPASVRTDVLLRVEDADFSELGHTAEACILGITVAACNDHSIPVTFGERGEAYTELREDFGVSSQNARRARTRHASNYHDS